MAGDGGDIGGLLNAAGSGVSTGLSDVSSFVGGLGNDVSSLFGGSTPQAASQTGPIASAAQITGSAAPMGASGGLGASPGMSAAGSAMSLPNGVDTSVLDSTMSADLSGGGATPGSGASSFDQINLGAGGTPDVLSQLGVNLPQSGSSLLPAATGSSPTSALSGVTGTKPSFMGNLSKILSNPTADLSGASLLYSLINANRTPSEVKQMQGEANRAATQANVSQNLENTAINGQLPGPAQAQLTQALQAAKAQVRAKYANLGMSGSSAEAEDIANLSEASVGQQFQIEQQIAQTGLQAVSQQSGLESQLLESIYKANTEQSSALGSSLQAFAKAAALGG